MEICVNGVNLFYQKIGVGPAIIMLHGNSEDSSIFDVTASLLSTSHTVYLIDSRCHGKSEKTIEISYSIMTEDMAAFIQTLKLDKPVFYGFSDGGIIGLMLAARYPDLLSKLIVSGANTTLDGVKTFTMLSIRLLCLLKKNPVNQLMVVDPGFENGELEKIKIPVLVLAGSKDLIKESHTRMIANTIPNSQLQIIEGEDHGSYIVHSDKLYPYIKAYFD